MNGQYLLYNKPNSGTDSLKMSLINARASIRIITVVYERCCLPSKLHRLMLIGCGLSLPWLCHEAPTPRSAGDAVFKVIGVGAIISIILPALVDKPMGWVSLYKMPYKFLKYVQLGHLSSIARAI